MYSCPTESFVVPIKASGLKIQLKVQAWKRHWRRRSRCYSTMRRCASAADDMANGISPFRNAASPSPRERRARMAPPNWSPVAPKASPWRCAIFIIIMRSRPRRLARPGPSDRHRRRHGSHRASISTNRPQLSRVGGVPALTPASRLSLVKLETEASVFVSTSQTPHLDRFAFCPVPSDFSSAAHVVSVI